MERIDHYQVLGELGRGGMGVVFRAWDPLTQQNVAIKLLLTSHNPKRLSRFKREVQVLQRLQHPNVIPIRAYGTHSGRPYMVMDLVEGKSLEDLVESQGTIAPTLAAEIGVKLASALAAGHELGILHRDVKPDNVLIRTDGEVVLGDFGLAKDVALEQSQLTVEGGFMGTPGFVAPEQAMGEANLVGPATDVYGLGATLYFALTGNAPVEGSTVFEVMSNIHKPPTRIRSLRSDVPRDLANLVQRCLKPELRERYRSCDVLLRDLQDFLRGTSRYATPGVKPRRRSPLPIVVALVGLGVVLGVGYALLSEPNEIAEPTVDVPPIDEPVDRSPGLLADALKEAQFAEEQGDWDAARASFERALVIQAHNADALHGLWRALTKLRDPRQIEILRRAVEADPRPKAALTQAVLFAHQQRSDEVVALLERSHQAYPEHADVNAALGRALSSVGRYEESLDYLRTAWEAEPMVDIGVALAMSLHHLQRTLDAVPIAKATLELEPRSVEALYLVGYISSKAGHHAEAVDALSDLWRITEGKHPQAAGPLAESLTQLGRTAEALKTLNRALDDDPQNTNLLFVRATLYEEVGRYDDELADLNALLAFDPNHAAGLNNRSIVLFHAKEFEASLADAQLLVKLEPSATSGWIQVGACQYQLKDYKAARDAYGEAANVDPESIDARVGRSQALHRLKDYEGAINDYAWVLKRKPELHSMRLNMGLANDSLGRIPRAREIMQDLQRRTQPGSHHYVRASDWLAENMAE